MTTQLTDMQLEVLIALVEKGPLWDGDIDNRNARDQLVNAGMAVKVVRKGEDGWTAATYQGRDTYLARFHGTSLLEAMATREAIRAIGFASKP